MVRRPGEPPPGLEEYVRPGKKSRMSRMEFHMWSAHLTGTTMLKHAKALGVELYGASLTVNYAERPRAEDVMSHTIQRKTGR